MQHRALGKGLEALIPRAKGITQEQPAASNQAYKDYVVNIKIEKVRPNKHQPRKQFDEQKLKELMDTIKEKGVINPILVRTVGSEYEIIAGERRWRAVTQMGLPEIPAIVKDVSDRDMFELSLIENIQREDLNPLEEAEAYQHLLGDYGLTQEELSKKIGKDRSSISNILRLLKLPDDIKGYIVDGVISAGHARAILSLETPTKQDYLFRRIIKQNLTVRQAEDIVKKVKGRGLKERKEKGQDVELLEIEQELQRIFATQIKISHRDNKGKIEINFFSDDDFDRIITLLRKK
jgi:ParB family transcriptional regulator, chromosome partitioning protein